jgi:hypothetical protein
MSANRKLTIDPDIWKRNLRDTTLTDDDACTRWFNNYFAFWLVCETRACKRTKRCAGEAAACRDRFMPLVPERMKFELRVTLEAAKDRLPRDEVQRKVREELARFDETTRVLERLGYAANSASPLPHSPSKTGVNALSLGEGGREQSERPEREALNARALTPPTSSATLSRKRERGNRARGEARA